MQFTGQKLGNEKLFSTLNSSLCTALLKHMKQSWFLNNNVRNSNITKNLVNFTCLPILNRRAVNQRRQQAHFSFQVVFLWVGSVYTHHSTPIHRLHLWQCWSVASWYQSPKRNTLRLCWVRTIRCHQSLSLQCLK